MLLQRHTSVFGLTLWCLLSVWVFFGCVELIEDSQIIPAIAENPQDAHDPDEAALAQLASGLRSDLATFETLNISLEPGAVLRPAVQNATHTVYPFTCLVRHDPPSLPLYQQLSVYRI